VKPLLADGTAAIGTHAERSLVDSGERSIDFFEKMLLIVQQSKSYFFIEVTAAYIGLMDRIIR